MTLNNLSQITIEREVLITQETDIFYFSDVYSQFEGGGLTPDESENWITPNQIVIFMITFIVTIGFLA